MRLCANMNKRFDGRLFVVQGMGQADNKISFICIKKTKDINSRPVHTFFFLTVVNEDDIKTFSSRHNIERVSRS
jgi:hypothetical protein